MKTAKHKSTTSTACGNITPRTAANVLRKQLKKEEKYFLGHYGKRLKKPTKAYIKMQLDGIGWLHP